MGRVAVTGASGMIGQALCARLAADGWAVTRLVRGAAGDGEARWSPDDGALDPSVDGVDAVVHLAGESIAGGRWSPERKARIRDSRSVGTRRLCEGLAGLRRPPAVLVSASAIGIYGDRGDEVLTEASAPGEGFLAEVCRGWEEAAAPARDAGVRVVHLRIGIVLDAAGGALKAMLTPFRLGVGGRLGSGAQWVSWVSLHDVTGAAAHVLASDLSGPVNAVGPSPVTNAELTRALASALHRPALVPAPAFALRMAMGREMADELLLASARVRPARLVEAGYAFRHPTLESALAAALA